tara:strand:- start:358 stop:486 length:129 start_codon:yes stop_codon:yes gene_type:complete
MDLRDYFKEIEADSTHDAWLVVKDYLMKETQELEEEKQQYKQ